MSQGHQGACNLRKPRYTHVVAVVSWDEVASSNLHLFLSWVNFVARPKETAL